MTIYLPTTRMPKQATYAPIVFGGWQTPGTGGVEQWLGFLGTRGSMAIVMPNLRPEPEGRLLTAALATAWTTGQTVTSRFPQPGLRIGAPGSAVVVDGSGQAGSVLKLRGLTPSYALRIRQFFSLVSGGRRYLYFATASTIADATGRASVPVAPMLRIQPADGDACEIGAPMIEGKLAGDDRGWTMIPAFIQGPTFTIAEIA